MSILFWELFMLLLLFVFSQLVNNNREFNVRYTKLRAIYLRSNKNKFFWPEGYIFGIAWTILYLLIFSSFMLFAWESVPDNNSSIFRNYFENWDGIMLMFILNIVMNKWWSLVFMEGSAEAMDCVIDETHNKGPRPSTAPLLAGAYIIVLLITSGLAVEVLLAIEHRWISFGLYAPYILWLFYALILNVSVLWFVESSIRHKYLTKL